MEDQEEYRDQMKEELSKIPLGELKKMQEKVGLKKFKEIKCGKTKSNMKSRFKRLNRHRPAEYTARLPVPKQTVAASNTKTRRDPRFDDLSGDFDQEIFNQSYGFINEMRTKEKETLIKMITETKDKSEKKRLKILVNKLKQKEEADERRKKRAEMEKEWKKKEAEKVLEGKKPYFLKESQKRALFKQEYEKELAEKGKLNKYTERKNKKLASLEKKRQKWKTDS